MHTFMMKIVSRTDLIKYSSLRAFILLCFFSFLVSCEKDEEMQAVVGDSSELVTVTIAPYFLEEEVISDDGKTRSSSMLDPGIENSIFDIWVIQYADGGVILKSEHYRNDPNELGVLEVKPFNVQLYRRTNTTICLVANLQPGQLNSTYPWAGSLNGFKRMMLDLNLNDTPNNPSVGHIDRIRMFGYFVGDITAETTSLNVTLGRMISRVALNITNNGRTNLTNTRVEVKNVPQKIPFFPTGDPLPVTSVSTPAERDEYFTSYSENIGNLNVGQTVTRYYYMGENLNPQESEATTVVITGMAEGSQRSSTVVLGGDSPGVNGRDLSLARNYGYVFGIKLKVPLKIYTDLPKNPAWSVARSSGITNNINYLVDGNTTNTRYTTLSASTNTYFVIDMKEQKTFNYLKFLYNGTSNNYRVSRVVISGSNSSNAVPGDEEFTVLETVDIPLTPNATGTPLLAQLANTYNYRFVKIQFSAYPNATTAKRIVEFYLGETKLEY